MNVIELKTWLASASEVFISDANARVVDRYESEAEEALDAAIDNRDSPRVVCNDEAASDKCRHNGYPPFCDCEFSIACMFSVVLIGLKLALEYPSLVRIHAWNKWNQKLTVLCTASVQEPPVQASKDLHEAEN